MSAVGAVAFTRRYWKCTCGTDGSYAADTLLGVEGMRYTKTVQKHCCRLAADMSFACTSENLHEMLGVDLCPETVRTMVEGRGQEMARFQAADAASEKAFQEAAGEVEFTTDAGKVNTREEGWKDLKIAVISKREAGEPTTPDHWQKQRLAGGDDGARLCDDRHRKGVSQRVAATVASLGRDVFGELHVWATAPLGFGRRCSGR